MVPFQSNFCFFPDLRQSQKSHELLVLCFLRKVISWCFLNVCSQSLACSFKEVLASIYLRFYLWQSDGFSNISRTYPHGFYNPVISSVHFPNLGATFYISVMEFYPLHTFVLIFYKKFLHKGLARATCEA